MQTATEREKKKQWNGRFINSHIQMYTKVKCYREKKCAALFFSSLPKRQLCSGFSACITNCLQATTSTADFIPFPFASFVVYGPIFNSLIIFTDCLTPKRPTNFPIILIPRFFFSVLVAFFRLLFLPLVFFFSMLTPPFFSKHIMK